jgi:hypothetical protein
VHLRVDFEDSWGIEPTAIPVIISHAPFELQRQSITEIDVQQSDGVQDSIFANINLAGGKGGASKAVSQSKVENYKDLYFGKGVSATVANEKGTHSGGLVECQAKLESAREGRRRYRVEPSIRGSLYPKRLLGLSGVTPSPRRCWLETQS